MAQIQKTEVKNSLKSIEELAEEQNLKAWVFAGIKAEKKWAAGRMVTEDELKKAVQDWLKAPMHGSSGKEKK